MKYLVIPSILPHTNLVKFPYTNKICFTNKKMIHR